MRRLKVTLLLLALTLIPSLASGDVEYFKVLGHEITRFAAAQAKIDAVRALEITQEAASEPAFTMVELVMDGPTPIFEILFVSPAGPSELEVDAVTGKAVPLSDEPGTAEQRADGLRTRAALAHCKIDLRGAMEIASQQIEGGTIVRAQAIVNKTGVKFDVEVLTDGTVKIVSVSSDGAVEQVAPNADEPGGRCWTFDREPVGEPPAGWSLSFTNPQEGKARWTVERATKPMTGPNALVLVAESGTRVYNVALATGTSYGDVDVRTRLRADSGKVDQGGGLVWRCKDANNYYICRFNPLESNFRAYRVIGGHRHQLQSVNVVTEPGKWYAVRAKMIGDHIMCFLEGKKLLDVHDTTLEAPGMIGLWTKADASSSFDNIAVRIGFAAKADSEPIARPSPGPLRVHGDDDDDDDDHDD